MLVRGAAAVERYNKRKPVILIIAGTHSRVRIIKPIVCPTILRIMFVRRTVFLFNAMTTIYLSEELFVKKRNPSFLYQKRSDTE